MASLLQAGSTRPAPVPCSGHTAPNRWSIACSSGRPASRPGTTLLSVCPGRAPRGLPPRARRSFFERLHGLGILLVGLRPRTHMREAQLLQGAVDRIVGYRDAELLMQLHDQIARPPAHHAMARRDRTLLDQLSEKSFVFVGELAGRTRRELAEQAVRPLFVEPYHPVPQRLAVHAAGLRRLRP